MQNTVKKFQQQFGRTALARRRWAAAFAALALLVALGVTWRLKLTGVAMTAEPTCGLAEHTHTAACYTGTATGETAAGEGQQLGCGLPEHTHTAACYSDATADVETPEQWTATLPELTEETLAERVAAVAASQLGYTESKNNYQAAEDGTGLSGYTRYGAWYGSPYGAWDGMFAAFCLNYAGVPEEAFPQAAGAYAWAAALRERGLYLPADAAAQPGDLVFFDEDADGEPDRVGLVQSLENDAGGVLTLTTVEGDLNDKVETSAYPMPNERVIGYGDVAAACPEPAAPAPTAVPAAEPVVLTFAGGDYTVTLTCTADAGVPADAGLSVRELEPGSEEYNTCYVQAAAALAEENGVSADALDLRYARFFDVTILVEGQPFEPAAPVQVNIDYDTPVAAAADADAGVVHFAEQGTEVLTPEVAATAEGMTGVQYEQGSFSISGITLYSVSPQAEVVAVPVGDPIDFESYLTDAAVQHHGRYETAWRDVDANGEVLQDDSLRFQLDYVIPADTLSDTQNTIFYELPDSIKSVAAATGTVTAYDDPSKAIGAYTVREDGRIEITFIDEYVQKNKGAAGQSIPGHIRFESSVSQVIEDTEVSTTVSFKDTISLSLTITDRTFDTADLQVEKTADIGTGSIGADGLVTYSIKVSSQNGTKTPPVLTDTMTNVKLVDGAAFTVTDKNGQPVSDAIGSNVIGADGKSFTLTMANALAPGEEYTVTYRAKLDAAANTSGTAGNKVVATATSNDDKPLRDEVTITNNYDNKLVGKTGKNNGDGTISWTITINESKQDIGGWTLTDVFNLHALTAADLKGSGKVMMTDGTGAALDITTALAGSGYTFPAGAADTYTVTYTTADDYVFNAGQGVTNTATLTPAGGGEGVSGSTNVGVGQYDSTDKAGTGATASGTEIINGWQITFNTELGAIPAGTVYTDTLDAQAGYQRPAQQYCTAAQIADLEAAVAEAFRAALGEDYASYYALDTTLLGSTELTTANQFTITFLKEIPRGTPDLVIPYKTTVDYSGTALPDAVTTYYNLGSTAYKELQYNDPAENTYNPVVYKFDNRNEGGGDNTNHEYYNAGGEIQWQFRVVLPAETKGDTVITEKLPAGVKLKSLNLCIDKKTDGHDFAFTQEGGLCKVGETVTWSCDGFTATARYNADGTLTITLPDGYAALAEGNRSLFVIKVQIDSDLEWAEGETKRFKNEVLVKDQDDTLIGTAGQTQNYTKDLNHMVVAKTCDRTAADTAANLLPYKIIVNPNGEDKLPGQGNDTLTLKDTMTYNTNSGKWSFTLVPGSVHVYDYTGGVQGAEIPAGEVPSTYTVKEENGSSTNLLTIKLPDERALLVTYTYRASGTDSETYYGLNNKVEIEGLATVSSPDHTATDVTIHSSDAGAVTKGITLFKHRTGYYAEAVAGAVYSLYKYNGAEYLPDGEPLTTDANGYIQLATLDYNTAYYLVETTAPGNYILDSTPLYFYIKSNTSGDLSKVPATFSGRICADGDILEAENQLNETSLRVLKKWQNEDGTAVDGAGVAGEITYKLYQQVSETKGGRVTLNIDDDIAWGSFAAFNKQYVAGSTVTLNFRYTAQYNGTAPSEWSASVNGKPVNPAGFITGSKNADGTWDYTLTYTPTEDTSIILTLAADYNDAYQWTEDDVSYTLPAATTREYAGSYNGTITAADGWVGETITGLPLQGTENGKTVYYSYSIAEITVNGSPVEADRVSYSANNEGTASGDITVTNVTSDAYNLPKTGGAGTLPYTQGGLALMGAALLLAKRKRGRGQPG